MQTLFRLFLKLIALPGEIGFSAIFRTTMIVGGIAVLYLLTLRKDEEGKIADYFKRLWNKINNLRQKALSRHLAFISVTAGTITSAADKIFGPRMFSIQAMCVSVSLALFCLNSYFFVGSVKDPPITWRYLIDSLIVLLFALFPWLLDIFLARNRSLKSPLARQTFIFWWSTFLLAYLAREYISPFTCISCYPAQFHRFLFVMFLMLAAVVVVGAVLFTFFVVITRFSLKQLSLSKSTSKSILLLLIGCLPIPIFWILLRLLVFIINTTEFTSSNPGDPSAISHITGREWFTVCSIAVFALAFFINLAFLLAPVLFFLMALLLLIHRLIWPIIERPLEKLNEAGFTNRPKIIGLIAFTMILIGLGKIEWLEKALKLAGF